MAGRLLSSRYVRNVARSALPLVALLFIVAVAGFAVAPDGRGATIRIIVNFFITLVMVIGLQIFTGNSGVPSYGHAAFVGVGAYVTAWVTIEPELKADLTPGLPAWLMGAEWGFVPTVLAAAVVGAALAFLFGLVVMRMKETAIAMSTLALLVIAHGVFTNWDPFTRGTEGLFALPVRTNVWIAFAVAAVAVVVALAFKYSPVGLRLQASREDSLSAETTGVDVVKTRMASWVLSAAVSAAAGSVWAQYNLGFAPAQFYWTLVLTLLSILVIGGMATVSGAVIGAGLYAVVYEVLRGVEQEGSFVGIPVPQVTGLTQMVVAFATLMVLIYRRDGLLAWWELDGWFAKARARLSRSRGGDPAPPTAPPGVETGGA
jgi:branched-chain amino acid transport system permease protein